jgi:hypothetical protein
VKPTPPWIWIISRLASSNASLADARKVQAASSSSSLSDESAHAA